MSNMIIIYFLFFSLKSEKYVKSESPKYVDGTERVVDVYGKGIFIFFF